MVPDGPEPLVGLFGEDTVYRVEEVGVGPLAGAADPAPQLVQLAQAEDVRLEAYRRITGLRAATEIDDVRTEWVDRFGPLPAPAEALLAVARLRVECLRLGITELAVTVPRSLGGRSGAGGTRASVKVSPLTLPASAEVRLRRLAPGATYQADLHRLVAPLGQPATGTEYAPVVVDLLRQLVPPPEPGPAGTGAGASDGSSPDLPELASTR